MNIKFKGITFLLILVFGVLKYAPTLAHGNCSEKEFLAKICISELDVTPLPKKFPCADPKQYPTEINEFRSAFRLAPSLLRPMLCQVEEYQLISTKADGDYSAYSFNAPRVIGVNKNEFSQRITSASLGLWFRAGDDLVLDPSAIPSQYGVETFPQVSGLLVLADITHEIGHMLQAPNDKSLQERYFWNCNQDRSVCGPFSPEHYGYIDWISPLANHNNGDHSSDFFFGLPRPENVELLKFMASSKKNKKTFLELETFHKSLYQSGFATPWSTPSPEEDFCEMFSFYILAQVSPAMNFRFTDSSAVNVMDRLSHPTNERVLKKIEFIKKISQEFQNGGFF